SASSGCERGHDKDRIGAVLRWQARDEKARGVGLQPLDGRLVEAFDGFVTDEFVVLVAEVRDQILVLDDDAMAALPDRRHRSRLTKLRRRIAAGSAGRV